MTGIPTFTLARTGDKIPAIAMGTGTKHRIKKRTEFDKPMETASEEIVDLLVDSISYAGFNHIDTAENYTTELEIGETIRRTNIDRSKIWITSKYDPGWNKDYPASTPSGPYEALNIGLRKLGLEYIDLYLIHSPFFSPETSFITLEEAWFQMEKLVHEGKARNIGVSNFDRKHIEQILKVAKINPQVNQIEFHSYLQNQSPGIINFCKENEILVEAYAPLTPILPHKIKEGEGPLDALIEELTKKYGVSKSQLILRWVYQSGVLPITTSSNKNRLKESTQAFEFEIEVDDFKKMTEIGKSFHYRAFLANYFDGESEMDD